MTFWDGAALTTASGKLQDVGAHRTPEATRRLARLAGAVYMLLGLATLVGF